MRYVKVTDYPGLRQLTGAYFHQDWDLDYDSPQLAVEDFVRGDSRAPLVPNEVRHLLEVSTDDDLRRLIFDDFFIGYDPNGSGRTLRQWLGDVAEQIEALLDNPADPTG